MNYDDLEVYINTDAEKEAAKHAVMRAAINGADRIRLLNILDLGEDDWDHIDKGRE